MRSRLEAGDESGLRTRTVKCLLDSLEMMCEAVKVVAAPYGSGHGRFNRPSPWLPRRLLDRENKNNTSTPATMWD